jgi:hypothetical protein
MKLSPPDQKIVNAFFREHVDRSYKNPMNSIRLNSEHTKAHRERICEVCNHLIEGGVPFWTEVRLKNGCIPDIVTPTHVVTFIEVLGTETMADFYERKFSKYELAGFCESDFVFVDANSVLKKEKLY